MRRAALCVLVGCTGQGGEKPAADPPPPWGVPISGGTMIASRDGTRVVIADPDRDRIFSVELGGNVTANVALPARSEPGRLVEDGAGRVHVALRGSGELLTLDAVTGATIAERYACAEPRGVAWDAATDLVHVACATGALVTFPAAGGDAVRSLDLGRDLRDVVVSGAQLIVTRFRSPELITLDASGAVVATARPPLVRRLVELGQPETIEANATVAWRTIALPDGRLLMSHQRKRPEPLHPTPGGYDQPGGHKCGRGMMESAITVVTPGSAPVAVEPFVEGSLPVDVAADRDQYVAFVSAGTNTIQIITMKMLGEDDDEMCGEPREHAWHMEDRLGIPTSVAFAAPGELAVFYPELPALVIHHGVEPGGTATTITLPGELGYDAGRALFHREAGAPMACASCHPEAGDDGQVWDFGSLGLRRTQNLRGGILARGPYHWTGDMADLPTLMTDVFSERMSGGDLMRSEKLSLGPWLDRVRAPEPKAVADDTAVARGRELFTAPERGCITCHSGPLYTSNALVDVGTGGVFKVPSLLGVGARAPFLHDGCAATLRDRFVTCGGSDRHGITSTLSATQLTDLIAFLESL